MNMDTYHNLQLIQQSSDEQMQQQQQFQSQGINIMPGDASAQEVIVQDDSNIVYSPIKTNDQTQYMIQQQPQEQFMIQQQSPQQPQQVFYTNISPQNQNRIHQQQTIALNHNIMTQQNQNQQKVRTTRKYEAQYVSFILFSWFFNLPKWLCRGTTTSSSRDQLIWWSIIRTSKLFSITLHPRWIRTRASS